jgi:hypothetical protein
VQSCGNLLRDIDLELGQAIQVEMAISFPAGIL